MFSYVQTTQYISPRKYRKKIYSAFHVKLNKKRCPSLRSLALHLTKFFCKNRKVARFCCSTCPRWIAKKSAGMSNAFFVNLGIPILFERQHHKSQINESNLHISRTPKKERRKIKWNHLLVRFLQNCLEIHFWQTCVQPILRSFITTHKFQLHSAWKGSEVSLSPLLLLYPLGKGYTRRPIFANHDLNSRQNCCFKSTYLGKFTKCLKKANKIAFWQIRANGGTF